MPRIEPGTDLAKTAATFVDDLLVPHQRRQVERMRRELRAARVIALEGAHHYFFVDDARGVVDEMRRFLTEE